MKDASENPINLSELTDFQFGPAWARVDAAKPTYTEMPRERRSEQRDSRPRRPHAEGGKRTFNRDERRGERPERRERNDRRERRNDTRGEQRRQPRELPQPAEGFRVELRPANNILEIFAAKVAEQKRALPLLELARVVMGARERYDVVFMKLPEGASMLIHSTKADGACWLTKAEALAYLHTAPWFGEYYSTEQVETEAPKGSFSAVAVCSMGGEVIGPVNWHGYQSALMNLYRSRYAAMPLEVFKKRINLEKDEAAVAAWLESASHKTVWKPLRDDAADVVLEDAHAVEADFEAHHFADVYETTDKVFINGATEKKVLSPGIFAHLVTLADKTRRFPQMLIPNLCHGMARHHMPIYKWHGNHYTGPSRVRAIPADMVLADRMMAIVNWSKENSGKKADAMFAELTGVPAGTDEESRKQSAEAYAPYVADMLWLLEQGFIVVTGDNAVWFPKGEAAPAPVKSGKAKGKKPAKKAAAPAAEQVTPAAPAAEEAAPEAPAATPEA